MEIRVLDNNYCTNVCICCIHHLRFGRDSRMELLRGRSGRKLKQTEFVTLCVLSPYLYHFTFHFEYKYIFLSILLLYRFFLSFFFTDIRQSIIFISTVTVLVNLSIVYPERRVYPKENLG